MTTIFTGWEDVVDGSETITVTLPSGTELSGVAALRRGLSRKDQNFSGIDLEGNEVVFNIPADELSGNSIVRETYFTDANSNKYTVVSAQLLSGDTRWRCICQRRL